MFLLNEACISSTPGNFVTAKRPIEKFVQYVAEDVMGIDWEFVDSLSDAQLNGSDEDDQFHQEICDILLGDVNEDDLAELSKVKRLLHVAGYFQCSKF